MIYSIYYIYTHSSSKVLVHSCVYSLNSLFNVFFCFLVTDVDGEISLKKKGGEETEREGNKIEQKKTERNTRGKKIEKKIDVS